MYACQRVCKLRFSWLVMYYKHNTYQRAMCLGRGLVIVSQPNLIQMRNSVATMVSRTQLCRPSLSHSGSSSSWNVSLGMEGKVTKEALTFKCSIVDFQTRQHEYLIYNRRCMKTDTYFFPCLALMTPAYKYI